MDVQPLIDRLHKERDQILHEWESHARKDIRAAKSAESLVLRNHLVDFLDDLEKAIKLRANQKISEEKSALLGHDFSSSQAHGRVRASTPNYTIDQVIKEYAIFRQVVMKALKGADRDKVGVEEIVSRQTELGMLNAATEFYNSLMAMQQKIFATISHDLRRPLQANYLFLELLEEETDKREREALLSRVQANQDRMNAMMTELLDSIGVEAGQGMRFVFEEVDLCASLAATKEESEVIYGDRIKFNLPSCPIRGTFDSSSITRLIENLVSNAFKYGDRHYRITVTIENFEDEVSIKVHNWGNPIAPEDKEKIFNYLERGPEKNGEKEGWR